MPTIDSILKAASRDLRLETELLIAQALNWSRAKVLAYSDEEVTADVLEPLQDQLSRLANGEPYAYITGEREFYGLAFGVSPQVLIPRPDTELLVELAIACCIQGARVADLGTGSGAIAISLAYNRQDLEIIATDISETALAVAQQNAARHNSQVVFVRSHWFEQLPGKFDVILSNPPYIRPNDPHLPTLRHEPPSALIAQDNGFADIKKIISGAPAALRAKGMLLIEHGYNQADEVAILFREKNFTAINTHRDLAGQPRVTSGSLSA